MVDQDRYSVKFSMEGLLRGDSKARAAYAKAMWDMGAWCPNDILELDEKNPFEGGEIRTIPAGRIPLTAAGLVLPVEPQKEKETVEALPLALPEPIDVVATTVDTGPAYGGEWEATESSIPIDWHTLWPPAALKENPERAAEVWLAIAEKWMADAAARVAKVEIERLDKRVAHATEDRERFDKWIREYWTGKHAAYVAKTLTPLLAACNSTVTPEQVAETIGKQAIATFTTGDPVATLEDWKDKRAERLAELLMEAISDDNRSD